MSIAKALLKGEKIAARKLGLDAYFVPGTAGGFDRVPLTIPETIPAEWRALKVLEETPSGQPFSDDYSNETGAFSGNADVLPGERRDRRVFLAVADPLIFPSAPTLDDRLILMATGETWAVEHVGQLDVIGSTLITYLLTCRQL
jgi:hypothetical protein